MIKIKVSYEKDEELNKFLLLIQDKTNKIKLSKNEKGRYKKAYIIMKEATTK